VVTNLFQSISVLADFLQIFWRVIYVVPLLKLNVVAVIIMTSIVLCSCLLKMLSHIGLDLHCFSVFNLPMG
jgi:hypothetical protein